MTLSSTGPSPNEAGGPVGASNEGDYRFIRPGWPVYCAEGRRAGSVARLLPNRLVLRRGWWVFARDVPLPLYAIERVADDRVYLKMPCAEIDALPQAH